jgi:hypothetical protein
MKPLIATALTAGLLALGWPACASAQQYTMPGRASVPWNNLYNPWNPYHTGYNSSYNVAPYFNQPIPSEAPPWIRPFNPQGMAHGLYNQEFKPTPRYYRPPLNVPYTPPSPLQNPFPSGW